MPPRLTGVKTYSTLAFFFFSVKTLIRFVRLCGSHMCAGHCLSKERVPFKVLCVCGRGGALFHTQPVGNSSPSPLVVAQFAYPAILHSPFFFLSLPLPEKQNRERRILKAQKGMGEKLSPKSPPASGAQQPTQRFGTEQRRLCCVWWLLKCSAAFQ